MSFIIDGVKSFSSGVKDTISGGISSVADGIGSVTGGIADTVSGGVDFVTGGVSKFLDGGTAGAIKETLAGIGEVPANVMDFFGDAAKSLGDFNAGVSGLFNSLPKLAACAVAGITIMFVGVGAVNKARNHPEARQLREDKHRRKMELYAQKMRAKNGDFVDENRMRHF